MPMRKIGRNDLCPCGSGKKFKKCHMGKEEELDLGGLGDVSLEEMGARITALPAVYYGRAKELTGALDVEGLTGRAVGIRFVDLESYAGLNLFGSGQSAAGKGRKGGIFINLYKTRSSDPDNIYLAISKDIDDASLVHVLAHALDYLGGSGLMPGTLDPLAFELGIPVDHLEHPEEFGYWLDYLGKKFEVRLDADDTIISFLYQNRILIKGEEIQRRNGLTLRSKSDRILKFLSERSDEVDQLIRNRPGYIGPRSPKD